MKAEFSAARVSVLSPREFEVASLVALGLSNKQVARSLGITESTVKIHLNSIFRGCNKPVQTHSFDPQ